MRLPHRKQIQALLIIFFTALPLSGLIAQFKNDLRHIYPPFAQPDWMPKKQEWQKDTPAPQDSNLTLVGLWPWGPCVAVAAKDNYAFIGNGGLFQVLDISDPLSPQIVGELFFGGLLVYDMAISGDFVFIPDGDMKVIDISEPTKPQVVAHLPVPGDFAHRIAVSGNYAYLGTVRGRLIVVDISSPIAPVIKSTVPLYDEFVSLIVPDSIHLFIKTESPLAPIYIYDVTDPSNPTLVGFHGVRSYAFALDEQFLYLCTDDSSFQVWDVNSPANPNLVSRVKTPFVGNAVKIKDNLAYITAGNTLLATFDISDSSQPFLLGKAIGFPETIRSLTVSSPVVLAASSVGFWTMDVTQPEHPQPLTHFGTGDAALKIKILNDFAYLASLKAGVFIVDISNHQDPEFVANFSVDGSVQDIAVVDSLAYLTGYPFDDAIAPQFSIVNVSTPIHPEKISCVSVLSERPQRFHSTAVAVSGNYGLVSHDWGFSIIDISDKNNPQLVKWIQTTNTGLDIAISGNFACLANGELGLRIFDISDPKDPQEKIAFPEFAAGVTTRNDTAFVALGGGLAILKILPSGSAFKIGDVPTPGARSTVDIALQGNLVYMAYGEDLFVIDVSDPFRPRIVGQAITPAYAWGVAAKAKDVFVAGGEWALQVYRNNLITNVEEEPIGRLPIAPQLYSSYPNPFNSSTIIEYEIPFAGKVELKVFNEIGNEVEALVNGWQNAGRHRAIFDAKGLPSGVYFYQLKFNEWRASKKTLIIR